MKGDSLPRKFVRTAASSFFSAEEVARARAYHRPLYWAGAADVALQAGVLAALAWSGAGAALDPGSLPWWERTPAYTAIVVAASAVVRTPLALWSGFIRERRWGFSTQRLWSWVADGAKAVAVDRAQARPLLRRLRRADPRPVCGRDDDARDPTPPA